MEETTTTSTTMKRKTILQMFLDATIGEIYAAGRLSTQQSGDTVQLVAYGESILAEVERSVDEITLYVGHYGEVSPTVDSYLESLGRHLNERPNFEQVHTTTEAPTTGYGRVSEAGQYITNSLSRFEDRSPAENTYFKRMEGRLREAVTSQI
jgi:hypothetical protein